MEQRLIKTIAFIGAIIMLLTIVAAGLEYSLTQPVPVQAAQLNEPTIVTTIEEVITVEPAIEVPVIEKPVEYSRVIPSAYTDIKQKRNITADDINMIISTIRKDESPFKGRGEVFIRAAEITGLDPLYILAHAALESGWGTSRISREKHNYFGIGAFDTDTYNCAFNLANYAETDLVFTDELEEGIIKGAIWIEANYYSEGYISLWDMIYTARDGRGSYASAEGGWIETIVRIEDRAYSILYE